MTDEKLIKTKNVLSLLGTDWMKQSRFIPYITNVPFKSFQVLKYLSTHIGQWENTWRHLGLKKEEVFFFISQTSAPLKYLML